MLLDLQREFLDPVGGLYHLGPQGGLEELLERWNILTRAAQRAGRPIVVVRTCVRADAADSALPGSWHHSIGAQASAVLVEGSTGVDSVDGLDLPDTVYQVTKKGLSAFQHTHVDRLLANLAVGRLVIAGGPVTESVSATVRQGAALGYEQTVVSDAVYPSDSQLLDTFRNRTEFADTDEAVHILSAEDGNPTHGIRRAVLVIDLQNDFVHADGAMARYGHSPLTDSQRDVVHRNARAVIDVFRQLHHPVIFVRDVQTRHGRDTVLGPMMRRRVPFPTDARFIEEGTWGADYIDGIRPSPDEIEIIKRGNSAFGFTPLHRTLRNLDVRRLVIVGGATHGCISDTVREGIGLGYDFNVVSDATYPPDSPYLKVLQRITGVDRAEATIAGARLETFGTAPATRTTRGMEGTTW